LPFPLEPAAAITGTTGGATAEVDSTVVAWELAAPLPASALSCTPRSPRSPPRRVTPTSAVTGRVAACAPRCTTFICGSRSPAPPVAAPTSSARSQARRGLLEAEHAILDELFPADRAGPIVAVLDGHRTR
jgi:hypothetical protein